MAGKLAGGGGKKDRAEVTADPNVIPFIDVMLVLLIIFMIAAPISTVDITVDMPTSKIEPSKRPQKPTWISITDQGQGVSVYVMNDLVPVEQLGEKTFEAVQVNTPQLSDEFDLLDQRIYIRADSETAYRNVVRVMNRLQDRGFT